MLYFLADVNWMDCLPVSGLALLFFYYCNSFTYKAFSREALYCLSRFNRNYPRFICQKKVRGNGRPWLQTYRISARLSLPRSSEIAFLLSQDDLCIAVTEGGRLFGAVLRRTSLYTQLSDERYLVTSDNSEEGVDISDLLLNDWVKAASIDTLLALHRERLEKFGQCNHGRMMPQ